MMKRYYERGDDTKPGLTQNKVGDDTSDKHEKHSLSRVYELQLPKSLRTFEIKRFVTF